MRSLFFWDVTQRRLVVNCGRFGTIDRSYLQGPSSPRLLDPSCLGKRIQDKIKHVCDNKFFENMTESKYLGTTLTDHNYMPDEFEGKLN
jgi:hypothetical protein